MSADNLQEYNNWITLIGVIVNAALTGAIIYLTRMTVRENKRSADAAMLSAKSANDTYMLTKDMIEFQKSKEQKLWENYRRFYGMKVMLHSIYCRSSLINAFQVDPNSRNYSMLKEEYKEPDFEQQDLVLYFETKELDRLFNSIRDYIQFKKEFNLNVDNNSYNWPVALSKANYLIEEFGSFTYIYDIKY